MYNGPNKRQSCDKSLQLFIWFICMGKVRFVPFNLTRLGNRVIGFTMYLNCKLFLHCCQAHDVERERHDNFTLNLTFTIIGENSNHNDLSLIVSR